MKLSNNSSGSALQLELFTCENRFDASRAYNTLAETLTTTTEHLEYTLKLTEDILQKQTLNHYHFKILKLILCCDLLREEKNFLIRISERIGSMVVGVSESSLLYTKKEYLKLSYCLLCKGQYDIMVLSVDNFIMWFQMNNERILDKYFLKLFHDFIKDINRREKIMDKLRILKLLDMFKQKGFFSVILKPKDDYFIDKLSMPTFEDQARVLELIMMLTKQILQSDWKAICDKYITNVPKDIKQVQYYFFSILKNDDLIFIRNLVEMINFHQTLETELSVKQNELLITIMEIFHPFKWFYLFLSHIQFDPNIVLDWTFEVHFDETLGNYLNIVLELILSDFDTFFHRLETINDGSLSQPNFENIMTFLIKVNLRLGDHHQTLKKLLDQIEILYDALANSSDDPLGEILNKQFTSCVSLSDSEQDCMEQKDTFGFIVPYSDSDED